MTATLIGLVGRKRTGKDTIADRLVREYGFRRMAFADELKQVALEVNPIMMAEPYDEYHVDTTRLSDLVLRRGWDGAKEVPEVRHFLQDLGVAIRGIDPDFWIRPVMQAVKSSDIPVVITDVRFPNEAYWVGELAYGLLVKVHRPGLDRSDNHISEAGTDVIPTDLEIVNDSTIEALYRKVDALADRVLGRVAA